MKKILKQVMTLSFATLLFSCGNNSDASKDDAQKAVDSLATKPAAEAVFVPFKVQTIKHKVADFAKWKVAFNSHDSVRKAFGLADLALLRNIDDSNTVWVVNKVSDIQKAKDFAVLPNLKEAMIKAGVIGKPVFAYYDVIREDTSKIDSKDRIFITHKVKDFDAWVKVYDGEGKATRAAQGMVDRVLARGVDDPNIVHIVFAITDMAKAKAAIGSEDKKKLMMSAGVEGKPEILFYRSAD